MATRNKSDDKKVTDYRNVHNPAYVFWTCPYVCEEKFKDKHAKNKKYHQVRDHCHCTGGRTGAVHSICILK